MSVSKVKKAITLIELLIAISLLAAIILGAIAFEMFSRRILRSSERQVALLNDASYALERMTKDALQGIGDVATNEIAFEAMMFARTTKAANAPIAISTP